MNLKHSTTESLLAIVGSDRASQTPETVRAAEAELACRTADEAELFRKKVARSGRACVIVGGLFAGWGLLMASLGLTVFADPSQESVNGPLVFRHFERVYVGTALVQAATGVLLLAGGLGVARFRRRGRILVLAALWIGFAFLVLFTLVLPYDALAETRSVPVGFGVMIASVLNAAFWGFLLWLPYRFFASERVRSVCSE